MDNFRIRILNAGNELEIEGSEAFVEKHLKEWKTYLDCKNIIKDKIEKNPVSDIISEKGDKNVNNPPINVPKVFGEWLNKFPTDIADMDKALLTAYHIQCQRETDEFKTSDVNAALIEHGIKLSNPSLALSRLSNKKYMFQTRKDGKISFKRVSKEGVDYLRTLLG
jgi:hypothetical protein